METEVSLLSSSTGFLCSRDHCCGRKKVKDTYRNNTTDELSTKTLNPKELPAFPSSNMDTYKGLCVCRGVCVCTFSGRSSFIRLCFYFSEFKTITRISTASFSMVFASDCPPAQKDLICHLYKQLTMTYSYVLQLKDL